MTALHYSAIGCLFLVSCATTEHCDPRYNTDFLSTFGCTVSGGFEQSVKESQAQVEEVTLANNKLQEQSQSLSFAQDQSKQDLIKLQNDLANLEAQVSELDNQLSTSKNQNQELKAELSEIKSQIAKIKISPKSNQAKQQELSELKLRLKALQRLKELQTNN